MAYENNNSKQSVYENYGTIFGGNKACSLGMSNFKYRLAVASQLQNNGNPQWDFKNQTSLSLDVEDLERILLACKQLIAIYLAVKDNPSLPSTNPIYGTTQIRVPLIARSTMKAFGEFIVGLTDDPVSGRKTFAFNYSYSNIRDGSETRDHFIFRLSSGTDGHLSFCDSNGNNLKTTVQEHLQFSTFIQLMDYALKAGRIIMGMHTAMKYSGGNSNYSKGGNGGGYSRDNYNSSGNNGGSYNNSSNNDFNPDEIPF